MPERSKMKSEVEALWRAVFGSAPAPDARPEALLERLVAQLPTAEYETLRRYGTIQPPRNG